MRVATQVRDVGELTGGVVQVTPTIERKIPLSVRFSRDSSTSAVLEEMERRGIADNLFYSAMRQYADRNYINAVKQLEEVRKNIGGLLGAIADYYHALAESQAPKEPISS